MEDIVNIVEESRKCTDRVETYDDYTHSYDNHMNVLKRLNSIHRKQVMIQNMMGIISKNIKNEYNILSIDALCYSLICIIEEFIEEYARHLMYVDGSLLNPNHELHAEYYKEFCKAADDFLHNIDYINAKNKAYKPNAKKFSFEEENNELLFGKSYSKTASYLRPVWGSETPIDTWRKDTDRRNVLETAMSSLSTCGDLVGLLRDRIESLREMMSKSRYIGDDRSDEDFANRIVWDFEAYVCETSVIIYSTYENSYQDMIDNRLDDSQARRCLKKEKLEALKQNEPYGSLWEQCGRDLRKMGKIIFRHKDTTYENIASFFKCYAEYSYAKGMQELHSEPTEFPAYFTQDDVIEIMNFLVEKAFIPKETSLDHLLYYFGVINIRPVKLLPVTWLAKESKQTLREFVMGIYKPKFDDKTYTKTYIEKIVPHVFCNKNGEKMVLAKNKKIPSSLSDSINDFLATFKKNN